MKRFLISIFLLIGSTTWLSAQELKAKVTVMHTRVQGVDAKVFQALEEGLNNFLNSRKWTDDQFANQEKIECSFLLNITKANKEGNLFDAVLTIQASRPVYNSDYNSPTVNFRDREVTFSFEQSQSIDFNENNIAGTNPLASNLTAIFAYYVYYILGLDYDSFSPDGGTSYFLKAQNIVNKAPENQKAIRGWASSENQKNRYWLVEQILNPRFKEFRTYWYTYHRLGLDMMAENPEESSKNIYEGISILSKLKKENSNLLLLDFYFSAKSNEWISLIQAAPEDNRPSYAKELMALDIPNAEKYRKIK